MELINQPQTLKQIRELKYKYGNYLKLTADLENEWLVGGGELHADGEKLLLKSGSKQINIWGGGIDLVNKEYGNFRP